MKYPFQQHQYSQVPQLQVPSVPPNPPPTQPPQPQPTGQALAAQRTTQLIAQGQFSPIEPEKQYPAQQSQPHFSPPPTQSQFQIQQPQFPPTPQFSQGQTSQARPQSQFTHGQTQSHHPHVPSQSHPHVPTQSHPHVPSQSHPHVSTQTHVQPQVHAPPNPPQQSQHYPTGPPDPYYLQNDMYYAMNTQGSRSVPTLHSTHAPAPTPHAHSMSPHSPYATFGPHTPPTNSHTPSSDGGPLLGLPRSHDSVSPASYASHPTSSSFDDSSSGHPASSASSGNVHMASQGMGHAATSSISTVTPGSPPTVAAPQQQQPQQRVQMRPRTIMPTTAATTTMSQAGPARPAIVPKPPAARPAATRRARAPKRPRPSTSQGAGGGGDSDDDSDDDDVVEWAGPSMPPQGAATGMGQRKSVTLYFYRIGNSVLIGLCFVRFLPFLFPRLLRGRVVLGSCFCKWFGPMALVWSLNSFVSARRHCSDLVHARYCWP
ncbi:hypothetical protein DEU56DRAFT_144530 [Suillus clintonianus]|uniref:uncharacterized protein n=1 Tax=Suillus clintonianus TaxID=1904413 RepID=UPI001B866A3F|nr:uncharacterized protein DEU56DRAFT_144530 [Suillus clintonianus]KAG2118371.1 hypothetical protein DEU56DRAFT_144530 [Suillus clintonianus]